MSSASLGGKNLIPDRIHRGKFQYVKRVGFLKVTVVVVVVFIGLYEILGEIYLH